MDEAFRKEQLRFARLHSGMSLALLSGTRQLARGSNRSIDPLLKRQITRGANSDISANTRA